MQYVCATNPAHPAHGAPLYALYHQAFSNIEPFCSRENPSWDYHTLCDESAVRPRRYEGIRGDLWQHVNQPVYEYSRCGNPGADTLALAAWDPHNPQHWCSDKDYRGFLNAADNQKWRRQARDRADALVLFFETTGSLAPQGVHMDSNGWCLIWNANWRKPNRMGTVRSLDQALFQGTGYKMWRNIDAIGLALVLNATFPGRSFRSSSWRRELGRHGVLTGLPQSISMMVFQFGVFAILGRSILARGSTPSPTRIRRPATLRIVVVTFTFRSGAIGWDASSVGGLFPSAAVPKVARG